jgi:hypothetical protein
MPSGPFMIRIGASEQTSLGTGQRMRLALRRAATCGLFFFLVGFPAATRAQSPGVADLLASTPVRVFSTNPVTSGNQGIGFGESVALDRELLAVGAPGEDSSETPGEVDAGSVYVFERQGDSWVEMQKLRAPTQTANERFGASVAIARGADLDGPLDFLVVGGPGYAASTGRAHVFRRRSGELWQHETILELDVPGTGKLFGAGVAIDWFVPPNSVNGDPLFFVAVGAPFDADPDDVSNHQHGSVTIFQRAGDPPVWAGGGALTFYGMDPNDNIGSAVALAGPDVVAAASGIDTPTGFNDGGAQTLRQQNLVTTVYNYALDWELQPSTPQPPAGIGVSAALHYDTNDSGTAVIGAPLDDTVATNAGKVYVFDLTPGGAGTTRVGVAAPLGQTSADNFGASVGVTGNLLVVGATGAGPDNTGQVLVYERGATKADWTHVGEFDPAPPNPPFECIVGRSVAIQEGTVVIGCSNANFQDEGVYVYFSRPLFEDGFESGDTTAWGATTP